MIDPFPKAALIMTYLEFKDGTSHKFWQIELEGASFTVTYGRIGTAGQAKTTTCESPEKAAKEHDKLVGEKTRKGYVEVAQASEKKTSRRLAVSYDEGEEGKTLLSKMEAFLDSDAAATTDSLVLASWEEPHENSPQAALDLLCEKAARLPKLTDLVVGAMDSEECEISWIIQADYTRVFAALPGLQSLRIQGSSSLVLSTTAIAHENLHTLVIRCGGMPKDVLACVAKAKLPRLEHLELYLGMEDYGFNGSIEDVRPFFAKGLFPSLKYLGLSDSCIADEVATGVATAPVLEQIETLDLSQGSLSDAGGRALLDSPLVKGLKKLDLHYHYLSTEMMKEFKASGLNVDVSDQQKGDEDDDQTYRYPAVGE
ncbi:MAG: STM4015 family protein [Fibrobacterota bacterium]|nr:MAG: STM4015 family protein [Fibrobacterota bacterium]